RARLSGNRKEAIESRSRGGPRNVGIEMRFVFTANENILVRMLRSERAAPGGDGHGDAVLGKSGSCPCDRARHERGWRMAGGLFEQRGESVGGCHERRRAARERRAPGAG